VLEPKRRYSEEQKEQILSAYHERSSMRGIERTFGVSRPTLVSWLKKNETNPKLEDTLCLPNPKMCWKLTKCGHLSKKNGTNAGFGQSCADVLAKS
jgi:hypothetical protein